MLLHIDTVLNWNRQKGIFVDMLTKILLCLDQIYVTVARSQK